VTADARRDDRGATSATSRDTSRTALVFPGQGSQEDGMRDLVARWRPELLDVLEEAVDGDPFADAATSTAAAQPAILAASLAYWHAAGQPRGRHYVGHSLGELTALCVAGAMSEDDAVRLAAARGRFMQAASDEHPGCGMLAVRASADAVRDVARECGVTVANDNAPSQVVLSGSAEGLDCAAERLRGMRIRTTRLAVAGAFHSPLMASAVEPFRAELARVRFAEPRDCVVWSAIACRPFEDPGAELAESLTSGVRWVETIERIAAEGADRFVEVGPGRALTKLIERLASERALGPSAPGDRGEPREVETVHARALH
jgi:[acyl-carrier-protein] S-malonyltransferase